MSRSLVVSGALLGAVMVGSHVPAEAQGRWTLVPSLTLAERYDDNLFATAHDRDSDFITRITPGVSISYAGDTFDLGASFLATGEVYAEHSDLNNFGDNLNGSFTLGYRPDERLTLRLAGQYARTNDLSTFVVPGVAPTAGPQGAPVVPTVDIGRRVASQYTMLATGEYRIDPRWTARAGYTFAFVDEEAGTDSRSHTGRIGASYDLNRVDRLYSDVSLSAFDTGTSDTSAALLLGWARQWTPDLRTSLAVGPRVTDGDWGAAAEASLSYQPARDWSVLATYSLGTGLAVGAEGAQNVSALIAGIAYQATRELRLGIGGSWTRTWAVGNSADDHATDTYGASASLSYQLTTWLVATLAYQLSYDRPADGDAIRNQQVTLGVTLTYPFRF